ncbi:hypothetical protein DV735_g3793, partial [Chaetothyriales sp. CBS 134920]
MGSVARPVRVAILECDTPLPKTQARFGGYGGVFQALLRSGAEQLGRPDPEHGFSFSTHQIETDPDSYPPLDEVDAILLTGSNIPWINKLVEYTKRALDSGRVKVIGVCFGHQVVGRALGAKVGRNEAWEASVTDVQLTPKGKELLGLDRLARTPTPSHFFFLFPFHIFESFHLTKIKLEQAIHQMHRDIVFYSPEGVEVLGSSPACKVQGMYAPGRLFTVQGHPEFSQEISCEILSSRHDVGVFDDEAYEEYTERASLPHDGLQISQAFIKFLLD